LQVVESHTLSVRFLLSHFDHRYGTHEKQTEKQANKGVLPRVSDAEHDDPEYRNWIDSRLTASALGEDHAYQWFFA
jgi:hypothetical protein